MAVAIMAVDADEGLLLTWELVSQAGVHHIPVIENGSCLGLLSERDLALAIAENPLGHPRRLVRELIDRSPVFVDSGASVAEVAETLLGTGRDAVLVRSDARLVGLVTARDLLRALAGRVDRSEKARGWEHARTLFQLTPVLPAEPGNGDHLTAPSGLRSTP
jgi:CBS domain-containing membrane protein